MRIAITGTSTAAAAITAGLVKAGYVVSPSFPAYRVRVDDADEPDAKDVIVDGIDGALESAMVTAIAELVPGGRVVLQRGGGVQDFDAIRIVCPARDVVRQAVERGVVRGFLRLVPQPPKAPWYSASRWKKPSAFGAALLLTATAASAQVVTPSRTAVTQSGPWTFSFDAADGETFVPGASSVVPFAGIFDDGLGVLATGQIGTPRITARRALHVNLRTAAGLAFGTAVDPVIVSGTNFQLTPNGDFPFQTTIINAAATSTVNLSGTSLDVNVTNAPTVTVTGSVGLTASAVSQASGSASASGNNVILTPGAGLRLRIFYVSYNPSAAVELAFRCGTSGALFQRNNVVTGGAIISKEYGEVRYVECAVNETLCLNLSAAVATIWNVVYLEV